jgi:hypothetical protein
MNSVMHVQETEAEKKSSSAHTYSYLNSQKEYRKGSCRKNSRSHNDDKKTTKRTS